MIFEGLIKIQKGYPLKGSLRNVFHLSELLCELWENREGFLMATFNDISHRIQNKM